MVSAARAMLDVRSETTEAEPSSVLTLRRRWDRLRVVGMESELGSRRNPTLPSFSTTATKFVRTLESGRGGGVAVPAEEEADELADVETTGRGE